ncbi:MAG TPA: NAD(P)-dependent oxidoreductase [Thermoplasmata archaeon]|nr:NAD(P)-dependent oxidoreductase [Thermoplasmata archaeon]
MRRALVAGAGGYLGQAIVHALAGSGWEVRGLVRTPSAIRRVEAEGGRPVVADILDSAAVENTAHGCDLLIHVAARAASPADDPRYAARVREEGCRNLLRAARIHGNRRVVVGSGYWVYADQPGTITEESPLDPRGESRVNFATEMTAKDPEIRGSTEVVVVRPGMVYGDGSWCRAALEAITDGTYRYIEAGANPWSFISREDAGMAFAHVAENGVPGEVYNVVDGRPTPWREFGDFVAHRLGRLPPGRLTVEEAERLYGPDVAHHLRARRACSSAKLERLGWKPRFREFREGLSATVPELSAVEPGTDRKT